MDSNSGHRTIKMTMRELLARWQDFEPDCAIYWPAQEEITLDTVVSVEPDVPGVTRFRRRGDEETLLAIEQFSHELEYVDRDLGRTATPEEKLGVMLHYAKNDAPMPLEDLRA